jgi:hypothetical protein
MLCSFPDRIETVYHENQIVKSKASFAVLRFFGHIVRITLFISWQSESQHGSNSAKLA